MSDLRCDIYTRCINRDNKNPEGVPINLNLILCLVGEDCERCQGVDYSFFLVVLKFLVVIRVYEIDFGIICHRATEKFNNIIFVIKCIFILKHYTECSSRHYQHFRLIEGYSKLIDTSMSQFTSYDQD